MSLPSAVPGVLGDTALDRFDVLIVGSGPGGSAAAYRLTAAGLNVLVLEAGSNYFRGLDDPAPDMPVPLFSNDELKMSFRHLATQDAAVEPRTYRASETEAARAHRDVNTLGRTVGGAWVHADMKVPRFNVIDFRLASALEAANRTYTGASFADWPLTYDELEPFYAEAEMLSGVSAGGGETGDDPFASRRSAPYPLPAGAPMYVGLVLSEGARRMGYHPFNYPAAINSRPYDGRPACVNCGFCSGYGCPNNSKGSGAVTTLRKALLTRRCQVRYNCFARRLLAQGRRVTGVEYVDGDGAVQTAAADRVVLAASPIESARLCFLSDPSGPGLGNRSGLVGRNLMFHAQTIAVGVFRQRFHGERGQSVTHGFSDFRGVAEGGESFAADGRPLGGVIEFGTNSEAIVEAKNNVLLAEVARQIGSPVSLKQLMVESPLRDHLAVLIMQAEDAPQLGNRVDLDPEVRDVFGLPVPRVTYRDHAFERDAAAFYKPKMVDVLGAAGAQFAFIAPPEIPSGSRHVMGTLRMGSDPSASVCDPHGKFHDLDNLYCADGSIFVTGSGYNPTLTIIALALRTADHLASGED